MPEISPEEWERLLSDHPEAHILQTEKWGALKAAYGWKTVRIFMPASPGTATIAAMVLFRKLPLGLSIGYIAKGPLGLDPAETSVVFWNKFHSEFDPICRRERAVFLRIEPDAWNESASEGGFEDSSHAAPPGFVMGSHSIQPRQTLVVDLRGSEADVLGRMKQKTRYNIRLAEKKGVSVSKSREIDVFYRLLERTGDRDSFGVHQREYYSRIMDLFSEDGSCMLLTAEKEGLPLAGLMAFAHGTRAWYFYGASGDEHRDLMPTYLLQWEAMRWARARGCQTYDLWGIPDAPLDTLERDFTKRSDGLWGVYRFKRGFGGDLRRALGPWDRVYSPLFYRLYNLWNRVRTGESHGD